MNNSMLSEQGASLVKQGLGSIENNNYACAAMAFDKLQMTDPNSWEACFYPGYVGVLEAAYNFQNQPTRIGSVVSLLLESLTKQLLVVKPRMDKVMNLIMKSDLDKPYRESALSSVVSCSQEMIRTCGIVLKETFKFRQEFRDDLKKDSGIIGKIKSSIESSSEESDFANLCSAVCTLGYDLGDELYKYISGADGEFYKKLTLDIWQQSTKIDYEFNPYGDVRKQYIAKIKALDPNAKVGGEFREFITYAKAVVALIVIAVVAFFFFDVPGRVGEFFNSFSNDEEIIEKFVNATSGRFTIKGEVIGFDKKLFGADEIYLSVQNSKHKIKVICKIDKLPPLQSGDWLSIHGKKVDSSTVEVLDWTSYTPTGQEPKYIEGSSAEQSSSSSSSRSTPVEKKADESSTRPSAVDSFNGDETKEIKANRASTKADSDSNVTMVSEKNETSSKASLTDSIENEEIVRSMKTFREYVEEMKNPKHPKNWHDMFRGKLLTLKVTVKKTKVKKQDPIVECIVDGENIVIYMRKDQSNKIQVLSKGDIVVVRGNIAKQRWGILHTMELSEGVMVE